MDGPWRGGRGVPRNRRGWNWALDPSGQEFTPNPGSSLLYCRSLECLWWWSLSRLSGGGRGTCGLPQARRPSETRERVVRHCDAELTLAEHHETNAFVLKTLQLCVAMRANCGMDVRIETTSDLEDPRD